MASWVLIPCLKQLFAEFDRIAPSRDKASDGSIGDLAHQQEMSDHNPDETGSVPIRDADTVNEVHAIDVDNNLNESDLTMEKVVQFILSRCRKSNSDPDNEPRLRYIIYNRRIWDYRSNWVEKPYTGPSPHTEHAHFSADYDSNLEASTASWHLEDIPVALTAADKTWIQQTMVKSIEDQRNDIANDVWQEKLGAPAGSTPAEWPAENMLRNTYNEAKQARTTAESFKARFDEIDAKLDQLTNPLETEPTA